MDFEAILDQAIAMLQRRGRLTYGALKRQFQLDDDYVVGASLFLAWIGPCGRVGGIVVSAFPPA